MQESKPIIHPEVFSSAIEKADLEKLKKFLTGFAGVQLLDARTICKEVVLPKISVKSPPPKPEDLITHTRICQEILGLDLGYETQLWIFTKSGDIKTCKEVFFSSEFKPHRNWENYQSYVPGLSFINPLYIQKELNDDDLKKWREFFKSGGIKENPDNGVEEFAINFALDKLKSKFNNVQLVEKLNYGYDIQAETFDGSLVQIEVKGVSTDQDVDLTGPEADVADTYKDSFYLCVVSSIPNSPNIHMVNNPAQPGVGKKDKLTIPVNVWKAAIGI